MAMLIVYVINIKIIVYLITENPCSPGKKANQTTTKTHQFDFTENLGWNLVWKVYNESLWC